MDINILKYGFFFSCLCCCLQGIAQKTTLKATPSQSLELITYEELNSGKITASSDAVLEIAKVNLTSWRIEVHLDTPFFIQNGSGEEFTSEYTYLIFNTSSTPGVSESPGQSSPLSSNPIELVSSSTPVTNDFNLQFYFATTGSSEYFDLSNGIYRGSLTFSLYDTEDSAEGVLVDDATADFWLKLNYSGNKGNNSIQLTEDNFSFNYSAVSDLVNDKIFAGGMQVTSNNPYQIMISSASEYFDSTVPQTIPMSVLQVEASAPAEDGLTFEGPVSVSPNGLPLLERTATTPKTMDYNLNYEIPAGSFSGSIQAGTYTGYVIFSIVPQ